MPKSFFIPGLNLFFVAAFVLSLLVQGQGPHRNGIYPETNLLKQWPDSGPGLLWQYSDLGLRYASAAVTSQIIHYRHT
ncbi:hypothetical protein DMA11_16270 [Marinilabiliaceae bacterium JC017]|nr:hypothetical protein DMA11_16270 [Marinilabiliaceae bacterium JC017]